MKSLKSLQEIIFPVRCLGCSALGLEICSQCRSKWNPHIYRSWSRTAPYFPIFSSIQYSTVASKVLLAAKENNIKLADDLLVQALQRSFHFCAKERGVGLLVPIPSRHAVARSRGRQFITELSLQKSYELEVKSFLVEIFWCSLYWTPFNRIPCSTWQGEHKVSAKPWSSPRIKFAIVKACIFKRDR